MEQIIFIVVFIFIFVLLYSILSYRQKQYSGLEIRQLSQELEAGKQEAKQGLRGLLTYLMPFAKKLAARDSKKGLVRDLVTAGRPLTIVEYYALVLLCVIIFSVGGIIVMNVMAKEPNPFYILGAAFFGFYLPGMWLKQRMRKRKGEISKDLPSIIDLLNLCVGSGMDFMLAVQRVIKDYRVCALTEELSTLWRENNMGTPRKEALRNLSWRVNLPEMSSFVSTLIQADKMGTPISDALEIQAEQMRIKRFQRGEEAALKAPIKLLIPLIFFILPVVAVIVAAPILLQFLQGGIKF